MNPTAGPEAARRWLTAAHAIAAVLIVLALAGCGRKAEPQPPPGQPNVYPVPYPRS
jgi:hypothetical protein